MVAFKELDHWAKSKDIEQILVESPVTTKENKSQTDNKGFDKYMQNYSGYYNFNTLIITDESLHFYDSHHLNQLGEKNLMLNLLTY